MLLLIFLNLKSFLQSPNDSIPVKNVSIKIFHAFLQNNTRKTIVFPVVNRFECLEMSHE